MMQLAIQFGHKEISYLEEVLVKNVSGSYPTVGDMPVTLLSVAPLPNSPIISTISLKIYLFSTFPYIHTKSMLIPVLVSLITDFISA